jgi:hypothetical protein
LYVLDDTLSAVDSHVGNHIFENVIGPNGLLKDTTRIFALNSIAFLKQCDRVMVMQGMKKYWVVRKVIACTKVPVRKVRTKNICTKSVVRKVCCTKSSVRNVMYKR